MNVDRRIRSAVQAPDGEVIVLCDCGGRMTPETGRALAGGPHLLWWRCEDNLNHLTRALPLPFEIRQP